MIKPHTIRFYSIFSPRTSSSAPKTQPSNWIVSKLFSRSQTPNETIQPQQPEAQQQSPQIQSIEELKRSMELEYKQLKSDLRTQLGINLVRATPHVHERRLARSSAAFQTSSSSDSSPTSARKLLGQLEREQLERESKKERMEEASKDALEKQQERQLVEALNSVKNSEWIEQERAEARKQAVERCRAFVAQYERMNRQISKAEGEESAATKQLYFQSCLQAKVDRVKEFLRKNSKKSKK